MNKKCYKCGLYKPIKDFPKNRSTSDGYSYECRSCKKEFQKAYKATAKGREARSRAIKTYQGTQQGKASYRRSTAKYCNSEHGKIKRREYYDSLETKQKIEDYYNSPEVIQRRKEYFARPDVRKRLREYNFNYLNKHRENEPLRYDCYLKFRHALKTGELIKPEICQCCDNPGKIEGHHEDYNKPLEVIWLCTRCHKGYHREKRIGIAPPGGFTEKVKALKSSHQPEPLNESQGQFPEKL